MATPPSAAAAAAGARPRPPTISQVPLTASPAPMTKDDGRPGWPRAGSSKSAAGAAASDPILRNALRYTISAREYAQLHKYVLGRSRVLRRRAPSVETVARIISGDGKGKGKGKGLDATDEEDEKKKTVAADDYNARAIRHSIRVFLASAIGMKLSGAVMARLSGKKQESPQSGQKKQPLYNSPTLRLSLSLSTILLLYRLLFRFLSRLRLHLLAPSAHPFRARNPSAAAALTSPYAPAVGASLAGLALGIYPAQQVRVTIAIYALFRALEIGWNAAEDGGLLWGWEMVTTAAASASASAATVVRRKRERPWWWGSWLLQPFAFGQLLHAVVFDRDCFPVSYGDFIFKFSSAYLHPKPEDYQGSLSWPTRIQVVDSLAEMARLKWPPFISPTLFPNKESTLPTSLMAIAPLSAPAHPLITSLSCATLHPSDPSCSRTLLTFWLRSFPPLARFFILLYSALQLPRLGSRSGLYHAPVTAALQGVLARALRTSAFVTGSISTAWASICLFQAWLPRSVLPTSRFFLGGFLAGFWAWVERRHGRGFFLYSARLSADSLWKVGVKRRWWRAARGGDVWVFVLAVMLSGVVYERDARAVREAGWRKGISWVRGEGWRDWGAEEEEDDDEQVDEQVDEQGVQGGAREGGRVEDDLAVLDRTA